MSMKPSLLNWNPFHSGSHTEDSVMKGGDDDAILFSFLFHSEK